MKPGATMRPVASKISVDGSVAIFPGSATSTILSPSRRTSRAAPVCVAGSMTRPFLTRSMRRVLVCGRGGVFFFVRGSAIARLRHFGGGRSFFLLRIFRAAHHEQKEQRHAHGDAVRDLLEDAGLRTVGDFGSDLDAAIHRAGMEDDGVGFGAAEALGVELIKKDVVTGGEGGFMKALGLYAEDENDVGIFESVFDAENATNGSAGRADAFELAGNPHGRAAEREAAAEFREEMNVGAGHA